MKYTTQRKDYKGAILNNNYFIEVVLDNGNKGIEDNRTLLNISVMSEPFLKAKQKAVYIVVDDNKDKTYIRYTTEAQDLIKGVNKKVLEHLKAFYSHLNIASYRVYELKAI